MKKIKVSLYFLSVIILTTSMSIFSVQSSADNPKTEWKKFFQSYLASVGIGVLSGVVSDEIAKYLLKTIIKPYVKTKVEGEVFLDKFPDYVCFLIASPIKIAVLSNIKKDMLKYNIPSKDHLMYLTALFTPFRNFLKDACLPFFESFSKRCLPFFLNPVFLKGY